MSYIEKHKYKYVIMQVAYFAFSTVYNVICVSPSAEIFLGTFS